MFDFKYVFETKGFSLTPYDPRILGHTLNYIVVQMEGIRCVFDNFKELNYGIQIYPSTAQANKMPNLKQKQTLGSSKYLNADIYSWKHKDN